MADIPCPFYTAFNSIEPTSKSLFQSKNQLPNNPQEPFGTNPDVHTRLQQIEAKLSRFQTDFSNAFSKLESGVASCQRTIESFKSITSSQIEGFSEDHQRNMIIKVKLGQEDSKVPLAQDGTSAGARTESLAEQMLSSTATTEQTEFKKVGKSKRLGRIYSRLKQSVTKVFSGPCVVTPILEIYPARMFPKPDVAGRGGHQ